MKIAIIGAGAMGSLFGAMLSGVSEVFLVDTNNDHVKAVQEQGLTVEYRDGSQHVYEMNITRDYREISDHFDLAIIFTKSYDTQDAAFTAQKILFPHGMALTLQNGIGNLEIIRNILGNENAVPGVTSHGGTFLGPGKVRHAGKGTTYIADMPGNRWLIEKIIHVFNEASIQTVLSQNVNSLIWGKLVINVGINALTAICRVPNGIIGKNAECLSIMKDAVSEAAAVASALGIVLPYDDPVKEVKKVCEATAKNRSSMLQDVLRDAPTEIGVINGAIVDKGEALGIPTPANRFLSQIIKAMETTAKYRI